MSDVSIDDVREALSKVIDPATGKDIISGGHVQGLGEWRACQLHSGS